MPVRALYISFLALAGAGFTAAVFPEAIVERGGFVWILALVPASLLSYFRRWRRVTWLLGAAMVGLAVLSFLGVFLRFEIGNSAGLFLVMVPYIAIALGAGWFSEVRHYADEQSQADAALRRLETALETMQMGVTITDLEGRIIYTNPADARMHGYSVDELIGRGTGLYTDLDESQPLPSQRWSDWTSFSRESTNLRRDGNKFPVFLRSDLVRDALGTPVALVTTCEDITERKQAEEKLHRANSDLRRSHKELKQAQLQLIQVEKMESVGRMAAGVAHEVKNPLMTILTGVKYLAKRLPADDANAKLVMEDMTNAVGRADTIVKGLLSFSSSRSLDRAQTSLNRTIEQALLLVKHDLEKHKIAVHKRLDLQLSALTLDEFKIEQVLVNVFSNAIHAMDDGGELTVRTMPKVLTIGGQVGYRKSDRFVPDEVVTVVQIDDTGPGVPAEHLTKIFDPFFTTKPTGVGTGLGLSVSRQIVEMHNGTIDIENREAGGARVTMMFRAPGQERHDAKKADSDRR